MGEGNDLNENNTVPFYKLNEASSEEQDNAGGKQDSNMIKQIQTVPFYKLFSFADSTDIVLMIIGTIGAIGNGLSIPFMTVLFGELTDSFGQNQNNKDVLRLVSKVINIFKLLVSFLIILKIIIICLIST